MSHPRQKKLLKDVRQPTLVFSDQRRFETPAPWRDTARYQLNLGELSMNLQCLGFEAPDNDNVHEDLLNGMDWAGSKAARETKRSYIWGSCSAPWIMAKS